MPLKACKVCNEVFRASSGRRYCSPKCREIDMTRTCPQCSVVFIARNISRIYCSDECYAKAQVIRQQKNNKKHYGHDFNPCANHSFFESEAERKARLGRKSL